jgi:hypothetical protein
MLSRVTGLDNQLTLVETLIEQAKLFREAFDNYHIRLYEYTQVINPPKPRLEEFMPGKRYKPKRTTKRQKMEQENLRITLCQARNTLGEHPFLKLLHRQLNYQQAFICFKKKIFDFYEKTSGNETQNQSPFDDYDYDEKIANIAIYDQLQFDDYIAVALSEYQFISEKKEYVLTWKKSRLEKIKKLTRLLQKEITNSYLFDDEKKQQAILSSLDLLLNIETPPKLVPLRRHAKLARELIIKNLAFHLYGMHYVKLKHYHARHFYKNNINDKKFKLNVSFIDVITHIVSIVDSSISERRVASVVTKIKLQIKRKYPVLFDFPDAN